MTNSDPHFSAESCVLRWARPMGATFDSMRKHVWETGLADIGDTILIWVNEGDFWEALIKGVQLKEYKNPDGSEVADGAMGPSGLTGDALKCQPSRLEGETTRPAGVTPGPSGVMNGVAQPAPNLLQEIHDAVNALGGRSDQDNSYDQGIVDTVAKVLDIIETRLACQPSPAATVETCDQCVSQMACQQNGCLAHKRSSAGNGGEK